MTGRLVGDRFVGGRGAEAALWATLAVWTAAWAVSMAHPALVSWHWFVDGAHALLGGSGLQTYAAHPDYQIGPLAFLVAGAIDALPGSAVVAAVVMTGLGLVSLWLVARLVSGPRRRLRVLLAGLVVGWVWPVLSVRWGHLDDTLALTAMVAALVAARGGRPVVTGLALAAAAAAKPWAVVAFPLVLLLPGRAWWRAAGVMVAGVLASWGPFVVADSGTLAAFRPPVRVANTSVMWWLGYRSTYLPAWDRLAQLLGAPLVSLAAVLRGVWPGALVSGLAVRLALDPQDIGYYAAGAVLAAAVYDLCGHRLVVPWLTLVTALAWWEPFVADYARRLELASGVSLWWFQHPAAVAATHLAWAAIALIATFALVDRRLAARTFGD